VYNNSNFRKQYNCDCQGMYEGWRNPKTGNLPKQVIWRKFWSNKLWHEINLGKLNNENRRCLDLSLESYTKLFLPLHQLVLCTHSQGRGILKLFTKPEKHNQFMCWPYQWNKSWLILTRMQHYLGFSVLGYDFSKVPASGLCFLAITQ